eukprot:scaffold1637_cov410-Prasinococcus_capsulatus_cf.AAC.12
MHTSHTYGCSYLHVRRRGLAALSRDDGLASATPTRLKRDDSATRVFTGAGAAVPGGASVSGWSGSTLVTASCAQSCIKGSIRHLAQGSDATSETLAP